MDVIAQYTDHIIAALVIIALLVLALFIWRAFSQRVRGRRGQRLGISEYQELDATPHTDTSRQCRTSDPDRRAH